MQLRAEAIVCAVRSHGETAVIARVLTAERGLVAVYVAGGRGRQLRPVLIPGNLVDADIRSRSETQLPFARIELLTSRGPWLTEPLPAAALGWACSLTAAALPERHAYPGVFAALTEQLGDAGVSIDKLIQESAGDTGVAPIAIMTHPCPRSAVESALQKIAELKITADTPRLLRIETRA